MVVGDCVTGGEFGELEYVSLDELQPHTSTNVRTTRKTNIVLNVRRICI